MISRDDVLELAMAFPKTYEHIRRVALRMSIRRQFILAAKLIAAQTGVNAFKNGSATFDSFLDQATSVPMSELRLQANLISNRIDVGPTSALMRNFSTGHVEGELAVSDAGEGSADGGSADGGEGTSSTKSPVVSSTNAPPPQPVMLANYGGVAPAVMPKRKPAGGQVGSSALNQVTQFLSQKAATDTGPAAIPLVNKVGHGGGGGGGVSVAQVQEAVSSAMEGTKREVGQLGERVAALQKSVELILERLPAQTV